MIYPSASSEMSAALHVAQEMCAAIRTAPKTRGLDYIDCCIVTGDELQALANKMEELGNATGASSLIRDAGNVRVSHAVVLAGVRNVYRGLKGLCRYCGFADCDACSNAGGTCVYGPMDLGIAVGAAVALAGAHHIDNRVMFSAGRAAMELGYLDKEFGCVLAIPLSVSGKSPYFDRK